MMQQQTLFSTAPAPVVRESMATTVTCDGCGKLARKWAATCIDGKYYHEQCWTSQPMPKKKTTETKKAEIKKEAKPKPAPEPVTEPEPEPEPEPQPEVEDGSGALTIGDKRLLGICAGCGGGIPFGYVPRVTKWRSVESGHGFKRNVPVQMYCHNCTGHTVTPKEKKQKTSEPQPATPSNNGVPSNVKEIAGKLFAQMSDVKPHSIRWLAKRAKVADTDKAVLKTIFKKLQLAGKIELIEGQWRKI